MQVAWNLANDDLCTTLCVHFKGEDVACGIIYYGAHKLKVVRPYKWWECDGRWSEVDTVLKVLAKLYLQPEAHYVEVGRL